jgi:hypothetical protein
MSGYKELNDRILGLESKVEDIISILRDHIKDVSSYITDINANFETLNLKIDSLHKDSSKEFGIVKSELKKIQEVTSYADKFENLKIIK